MKLYLVHCGFYDDEIGGGIYESHTNVFVAAESFEEARLKAKQLPEFKLKRMHVDGLQELAAVSGFRIDLKEDFSLAGASLVMSHKHRDLAPKPTSPAPA